MLRSNFFFFRVLLFCCCCCCCYYDYYDYFPLNKEVEAKTLSFSLNLYKIKENEKKEDFFLFFR